MSLSCLLSSQSLINLVAKLTKSGARISVKSNSNGTHLLSEAISLVPSLLYHMLCQLDRAFLFSKSQQHLKWIELVKERIEKRGWSQTDLATVVGVSPSAITQLFKDGKGSDDLKLRINKKLRINESWERFEE